MDQPLPPPEAESQAGDRQSRKARGNLGFRDGILHQTMSRLPVANQVFLGTWMIDICQESQNLRSAPQRKHIAYQRWCFCGVPGKPSSQD